MAVVRALPRSIGAYHDNWTLGAGANKVVAVQTDDGDTSYIFDTGANDEQSFNMDLVAGFFFSVSTITMGFKGRGTTTGTQPYSLFGTRNSATNDYFGTGAQPVGYTLTTAARATKPTGGAWTPAILDATEAIIFAQTPDDSPTFFCTWIYWDVTGVPFAGGIAQLIASLGPLVAVGLHEMPKLIRHLYRVSSPRRVLIEPHEVTLAWREMREDRHPRHFFMRPILEVI